MSAPIIKVERLGKEYLIGAREAGRESFREMLTSSFAAPFRRFRRLSGAAAPEERIWALKDVSFEVGEGEVVGIIGRNGAGKSTLLKILSRITEPTEGRALIRGRVASLLEVGTGFHPELTGRENIHLNGAILGMSRAEVGRKFDEIVAFAEVEKFLDTPVKRYSSGMAVRLAFAVAAHLDPDVLIVDEVLAVGDASFQKRCLGKIQSVASGGRTILFVSHNMNAITRYCSRVIYLDDGILVEDGNTSDIVSHYLRSNVVGDGTFSGEFDASKEYEYINSIKMLNPDRLASNIFTHFESIIITINFFGLRDNEFITLGLRVINQIGDLLFTCWDVDYVASQKTGSNSSYLETCEIPAFLLLPGQYSLQISLHSFDYSRLVAEERVDLPFFISNSGFHEGNFPRRGLVAPRVIWKRNSQSLN